MGPPCAVDILVFDVDAKCSSAPLQVMFEVVIEMI
jgi:hypothetical protein